MEPARDGGGVIEYRDSNQMVEATWVIFFHDQDRSPEMFTDEAAARRRLEQCKLAWTCDLFAHERELAEARRKALEEAAKVCEASSGVNAIPETNAYANGWNDCRKEAFDARQRSAAAIRAMREPK
jgi:hypothetical protein